MQIREVVERYNSAHALEQSPGRWKPRLTPATTVSVTEMTDLNFNFIKENIGNDLGQYSFMASSSMFEPEQQREILALADESFKSKENIQRVVERLENLENVAVGKKFVDFTLTDPDGNEVSLSQYAGGTSMYLSISGQHGVVPAVRRCPMWLQLMKSINRRDSKWLVSLSTEIVTSGLGN